MKPISKQTRTRILLVVPHLKNALLARPFAAQAEEAVNLASAIDLDICAVIFSPISIPRPSTLLGKGKVEEVAAAVRQYEAELIYIDGVLSPVQQRNLETETKAKVIDRTGLILEIFGERARTSEGVLQVELAHLTFQKSRLVRSWTHLERQRGGYGFLGGPGETQIETDRRLLENRITRVKKELEQVTRTRHLQYKNRQRIPYPTVALVGYTNAGKSTLFNKLTKANVLVADQLFATLDPTLRRIKLPSNTKIILSDTVGFIADLPTQLIAAFRATLEEVLSADLILHVRDITHAEKELQAAEVMKTLKELAPSGDHNYNILEVWNKIDLLNKEERYVSISTSVGERKPIMISAVSGEGCEQLLQEIETFFASRKESLHITVSSSDGEGITWLYRHGDIINAEQGEDMMIFDIRLAPERAAQARKRFSVTN
jgi:GTP-binding protein HflX